MLELNFLERWVQMNKLNKQNTQFNPVTKPSHYADSSIQPIDIIDEWGLDFCLGNAVKYIKRAGHKKSGVLSDLDKEIEDLEKAVWYINHKVTLLVDKREEEMEDE